jgi:hypothetical protein
MHPTPIIPLFTIHQAKDMPSTNKTSTASWSSPVLDEFVMAHKAMKERMQWKKRNYNKAKKHADDMKMAETHLKALLTLQSSMSMYAYDKSRQARDEYEHDPNYEESLLRNALFRSFRRAGDARPGTHIYLTDPNHDVQEMNRVQVALVDFEKNILQFTNEGAQKAWSEVSHLFTIASHSTTYDVYKQEQIDEPLNPETGEFPTRWVIGDQCDGDTPNGIDFFKRKSIDLDDSKLDHSGFISLCDNQFRLDLSAFNEKHVVFTDGTDKDDATEAVATLKLIEIRLTGGETLKPMESQPLGDVAVLGTPVTVVVCD